MEVHNMLNLGGINPVNFVVALLGFFCFVKGAAAVPTSRRQGLLFAAGGWILFLAAVEEQVRSGNGLFGLVLQSVVLVATLVAELPEGDQEDKWVKPLISICAGVLGGYILSQRIALDSLGILAVLGVGLLGVGFATQSHSYGPRVALAGCLVVLVQSLLVVTIGAPVAMSYVYILLNGLMSYNLFRSIWVKPAR